MNDMCEDKMDNFVPGDLLWTKIGKYPYWPCMVTYHPVDGAYRRVVKKKGNTEISYHVQYFGQDVQRGWTLPGNSIPFKGEKKYVDGIHELKSKINDLGDAAPKSMTLLVFKYKVTNLYKEKWEVAVKEAEEALLCSNAKERFENYVFSYEKSKRKTSHGTEMQLNGNDDLFEQSEPSTSKKVKYSEYCYSVCDACQETKADFSCSGICKKYFHLGCVGLTNMPENFMCIECLSVADSSGSSVPQPSGSSDNVSPGIPIAVLSENSNNVCMGTPIPQPSGSSDNVSLGIPIPQPSGSSDNVSPGIPIAVLSENSNNVSTGTPSNSCFVCKKSTGTVIKCSLFKCHKFYHTECVSKYDCTNIKKNVCPYHTCLTCYRANSRNIMAHKGPMVKCVKCPTAFHSQEFCIAAGSVEINGSEIICPLHFVGKNKVSPQQTCNMDVCSICSAGGELVCCEACPNAFHRNCLNPAIPLDDHDYICEDCENRRYLVYGMVVFSKAGKYRWWPAKIIHPSELPHNVINRKHYNGEFAVKFYGSYDYYWSHSGRTFPYTDEHVTWKPKPTNQKYGVLYKKSIEEAAEAYDEYISLIQRDLLLYDKPELFKPIKVNRALPPIQIAHTKAVPICVCKPTSDNPCGLKTQCLNRTTAMECNPELCPAKHLCRNQMFHKREYAQTKLIRTKGRGWGLAAVQSVKSGELISEYVGEVISHEEYHRRSRDMQERRQENYYFLYLDSRRMIDAGPMGNWSRFINHSCEPNCRMKKWSVYGDSRIGIFALEDISPGEEITFDYHSYQYEFQQRCFCAAETCRGFIGKKLKVSKKDEASSVKKSFNSVSKKKASSANKSFNPKNTSKTLSSKVRLLEIKDLEDSILPKVSITRISEASIKAACAPKDSQKKRKSSPETCIDVLNKSENHCFICKKTGSLLICEETGCVRAYHLRCIGLVETPEVSEKEKSFSCTTHLFSNIYKRENKFKRILRSALQIWNS